MKQRRWMPRTRKQWVVAAAIVVALLMVAYATYSVLAWRAYERHVATANEQIRTETEAAFAALEDDRAATADKRTSLQALAQAATRACDIPEVIAWQEQLMGLGQYRADCEKSAASRNHIAETARSVEEYIVWEERVAKELTPLGRSSDAVDEKEWPIIAKTWQQAHERVATFDVPASFAPVKAAAANATATVATAWQALIKAHEQKSQQAFADAERTLRRAYGALGDITTAAEAARQPLAASLYEVQPLP